MTAIHQPMTLARNIVVPRHATEEELLDSLRTLWEATEEGGAWLMIDGYNADPHELWEIPEAGALCRRLIRLGFLSLLVMLPEGFEGESSQIGAIAEPGRGLTGIGLWAIAQGIPVRDQRMSFHKSDLETFRQEVGRSNDRIRRHLERGLVSPDGQHRVEPLRERLDRGRETGPPGDPS